MRLILLFFFIIPQILFSQIPSRFIVNSGFEQPNLGCTNCFSLVAQTSVLGWRTTDPTAQIEIWTTNFQRQVPHSGTQFAEINANNPSFLYQELCLSPNESVYYSVWYLKRTTNTEQMKAQITDVSNVVISSSPTFTATNSWVNYTGTLINNSTGGIRRIGFVAVTGGSTGNLIDDIKISIKPIASLYSFSKTKQFEGDSTKINIIVNGTLLSNSTIYLTLGGTSTLNSDYTLGTPNKGSMSILGSNRVSLTLPPDDYNPNITTGVNLGIITIPVTIPVDGIPEISETIICSIDSVVGGGNGNSSLNLVNNLSGFGANSMMSISSIIDTILNTSPLPINLEYFTAKRLDDHILLKWKTVSETENDFFTISRTDQRMSNWFIIGTVKGQGTTNIPYYYDFEDYTPYNGLNYYELKQTDFNGNSVEYSPIGILMGKDGNQKITYFDLYGREILKPNEGFYFLRDETGKIEKIFK